MRTIIKNEAPACLSEAEKKGWNWEEFVLNDRLGYQTCRQQAYDEQSGVCAYTELPLDSARSTIHLDHFRRKGIYERLRFEWNNLFTAVKDNRFGSDYKDNIVKSNNEQKIYSVILSPLVPQLQRYFHYATNGEIEPSSELSDDDKERAKATIDIFHLNESELVSRRRTMMVQISTYHDLPEETIRQCFVGAGFPSVVDQELGFMILGHEA